MVSPDDLLARLRKRRLLAIVRGTDPAASLACVQTLAEEGIDLIEVRSPAPTRWRVCGETTDA
jgi:2-keto-3-deoxy-6-phosphogluconate aldolase